MPKGKRNIIAIIPARGGSRRFPHKNLARLRGKPLLQYPINAAKKSRLVTRVIVSTDSNSIARLAKKCGAEVPFMRPKHLATSKSPVVETLLYTVKRLEKEEKSTIDYMILLQAATPLITSSQIDSAINLALKKKADSVVAVSPVNTINHPYNIRTINNKNGTISFWKDKLHYIFLKKKRPSFYHVANMWITSRNTILHGKKLEGKKNYPLIVPVIYAADIDYKDDLEYIEAYLQYKPSILKNK